MTLRRSPDLQRRLLLARAGAGAGALWLPPALAAGVPRVALVIGNAAYAAAPLLNPGRDAQAVAARLAALGFQVIERRDATREQMQSALEEAAGALRGRDAVGLLYYAGHGLQIDWRNYMLPVDIALASAADVPRQGVDVQQVLDTFRRAGTRTNIVVLDACRDNPFGGGAGAARGLAPLDAPPGSFLAYATAPGNVAEDGSDSDGNGLYTRHLLQALQQAEVPIEELFKRVRTQVRRATGGRQVPWESTSLEEEFVFASGQRVDAQSLRERERQFELQRRDWERIRESTRTDDFYAFLQQHPSGVFSELAQAALDRLARPVVVAQAPAALAAVAMLPPGVDRYRVGDRWEVEVIDHLAGGARQAASREVTALEGTRVIVNGGEIVYDQLGTLMFNRTGRKNPGVLLVPSELRVGMRWRSDFTNEPQGGGVVSRNFYDLRVTGLEDIEIPAGRFRCFRIEAEGRAVLPMATKQLFTTIWVDPATMWSVRSDFRRVELGRSKPEVHDTTVTVSRQRVPR